MIEKVRKRLLDALGACRAIVQFTEHVDYEQYQASALLRSAVERQIEILGESLGLALHDDDTLRERVPEARRIVGMRNRVIHGYDSVDDRIVWDVVRTKVPDLMQILSGLLDES